jgi:hypothetical protein
MLLSRMLSISDKQGVYGARCLFLLLGTFTILLLALFPIGSVPAEDAVILHQYSRNLAETGVISYIPGGAPAEGATDFLWMLYLALGLKLHVSFAIATAAANIASACGLGYVLLRMAGKNPRIVDVIVVVGVFSLFPPVQAALQGFCVLPFALAIATTAMFALEGNDLLCALSALALCLLRPDGVVFAVPLLVLLRLFNTQSLRRTLGIYGVFFVLPGIVYFIWRFRYFGNLLPLPFLVKSNGDRVLHLFVLSSLISSLPYALLASIVLGAAFGRRLFQFRSKISRLAIALLLIPTAFYLNMRLDQNINQRFFFFAPVGIAIVLAANWKSEWNLPRRTVAATSFVACILIFGFFTYRGLKGNLFGRQNTIRLRSLATDIGAPNLRGSMLTTEAGILPFFSRWPAHDSWGLNTPEFARQVIQPKQVMELRPDLAIINQSFPHQDCTLIQRPASSHRDWDSMTDNIQTGLSELGFYDIWLVPYYTIKTGAEFHHSFGKDRYECWYISKNFPGRSELEATVTRYGATELSSDLHP